MKYLSAFLSILLIISCKNQSELSKKLNCTTEGYTNTKEFKDFNKNFKIYIPITWKTELYYNSFQSEIFTADTTKQLSESFILDATFSQGTLTFDEDFFAKTDSLLQQNNLERITSGKDKFKDMPSYWYIVKGLKKGFTYHQFNILVKTSEETYFTGYSEVYGDQRINERICESIAIFDEIEFLQ